MYNLWYSTISALFLQSLATLLLLFNTQISEFGCYEAKVEESEKGRQPLGVEPRTPLAWPARQNLSSWQHWATTAAQPPTSTILYMYCTGGTECLSRTPGSHSVCAVRTPLGVDRKFSLSGKNPCWVVFVTLNAKSILPLSKLAPISTLLLSMSQTRHQFKKIQFM